MSSSIGNFLFNVLLRNLFGKRLNLLDLANTYEKQLTGKVFHYTFTQKNRKELQADLVFDRSNFCHLMSIASIASNVTDDLDDFSGMKGWRNIQNGKITIRLLKTINPVEYAYYQKEYEMFDQLIDTIYHPQAVIFDSKKLPNSKLKSDILLYGVYGNKTIHLGISQDRQDGTWFARSYFVRDNDKDHAYPSKYVAGMTPLKVKVKASSKKA